jgi:uncharacterized protein YjdB
VSSARNLRDFRSLIPALALLVGVAACKETLPPPPGVKTVVVSPSEFTLQVDQQQQLVVAVLDSKDQPMANKTPGFTTSNAAIATVTTTGNVIAVSPGNAEITASVDGKAGKANVTVILRAPTRVDIDPPAPTAIQPGGSLELRATPRGPNGEALAGRTATWRSLNPAVVTVQPTAAGALTARVTAVSLGSAAIEVDVGTTKAQVTVTVSSGIQTPASVSITPPGPRILRVTNTLQLAATPRDANGNVITGRPVVWNSNNPSVATVSESGLVTAVDRGNATISADVDGRAGNFQLTVTLVPVTSAEISPDAFSMFVGQGQHQYSVTLRDSAGNALSPTSRTIVWSSTNLPIATVSGAGVVTVSGSQVGTARIAVAVEQAVDTAVLNVVKENIVTVQINPLNPAVRVGNTFPLSFVAIDSANTTALPTRTTATWTSADESIATVNGLGIVTGIKQGTVQIRATVEGVTGTTTLTVNP